MADHTLYDVIGIVVSRADSASTHIGEQLRELREWTPQTDTTRPDGDGGGTYYQTEGFELRTFDEWHIELDDPAAVFSELPAFIAFVSRHSGDSGKLLTAHVTGNFGPATYGGESKTLANPAPGAVSRVVDHLATHAPAGYDVGIECTHHGPTSVSVPSLFVELGSDEPQWTDTTAARAVAKSVLELAGTGPDLHGGTPSGGTDAGDSPRHVVGFGGGHYAPRFTRIVRETDWAVGHIGAAWALDEMGPPTANTAVLDQAFERSRTELAVIDGDRPALTAVLEDRGYRVVSETWLRAVGERPLSLVDRLEQRIATVADGLRFGSVTPESLDSVTIEPIPEELVSRAYGIDADATNEVVRATTVAFDTEQAGSRATRSAAVATTASTPGYADLVDGLVSVLETGYDEVRVIIEDEPNSAPNDGANGTSTTREITGSDRETSDPDSEMTGSDIPIAVVAQETAFDPDLARERGVPEGPAFGRLAGGTPVEIADGTTIRPADVSRDRTDRFPIPDEVTLQ